MSTGEKVLILIIAITLAAVTAGAIWYAITTRRIKQRANRTNDLINKLK